MYLQHIHLINYRNYENQELNLNRGINVLIGSNGQGKTNLLEAIYYLSAGNNFRGNKDVELIHWEKPYLRLLGQMKKDDSERCYELEVYIDKEKNKQLKINGVKSVSGLGLMLGIETEKDAGEVIKICMENGVLPIKAKNKVRLLPPLNITDDELIKAVKVIKEAVK